MKQRSPQVHYRMAKQAARRALKKGNAKNMGLQITALQRHFPVLLDVPVKERVEAHQILLALLCRTGNWLDAALVIERLSRIGQRESLPDLVPQHLIRRCRESGQAVPVELPELTPRGGTPRRQVLTVAELLTTILSRSCFPVRRIAS